MTQPGAPKQVVAEAKLRDSHWTTIHLSPGTYWVFLPMDHQSTLTDGNYDWLNLPDLATPVHAWANAIVPTDGLADVTLIVSYRLA